MKYYTYIKKVVIYTSIIISFLIPTLSFAKEINLLESPNPDSKIVGKVDLAQGIIPIFSATDKAWIKVGNPKNGDVGWIKSSELSSNGTTSVTCTQRIIDSGQGNGPQTYQIIEYGKPSNLSSEDVQKWMLNMQTQQRAIQQSTQRAFQNMMHEMNALHQFNWDMMNGAPVIMPIVIMPAKQHNLPQTHTTQPTPATTTQPTRPKTTPSLTPGKSN